VFVLTLGDFVTPQFFSSGEATIPGAIFLQVNLGLNWPTASGLSLLLIALILAAIAILFRFIDITDSFS
jgi:ABC-type spermidine/putrescine transport system permease subunit I